MQSSEIFVLEIYKSGFSERLYCVRWNKSGRWCPVDKRNDEREEVLHALTFLSVTDHFWFYRRKWPAAKSWFLRLDGRGTRTQIVAAKKCRQNLANRVPSTDNDFSTVSSTRILCCNRQIDHMMVCERLCIIVAGDFAHQNEPKLYNIICSGVCIRLLSEWYVCQGPG